MSKHLFASLVCAAVFATVPATAFADDQQDLMQASHALMQAAANSDGDAAERWLDPAFTATDPFGHTESRADALQDSVTFSDVPSGNPQMHVYGDVGVVTTENGKRHVLMVWAKRPEGWRALLYQEVRQAGAPPAASTGGSGDCSNPCKSVPYKPKNDDEQGVLRSWQQLESAVAAHDSAEWARHVADEFVVVSSASDKPANKSDRMAAIDRQKQDKTAPAPAPLVSAETFDFPDAVVMVSTQRRDNKAAHVTRVWVKRGGAWLLADSFQTAVQAGPVK